MYIGFVRFVLDGAGRVCLWVFFFNVTATTEFYTEWVVGSVRCVYVTVCIGSTSPGATPVDRRRRGYVLCVCVCACVCVCGAGRGSGGHSVCRPLCDNRTPPREGLRVVCVCVWLCAHPAARTRHRYIARVCIAV